ncbi:MAG: hypothetical protein MJZ12_01325 [Prevotella sp.]|nr:hypothetical protein [Prevotella sp.]
MAKEYQVSDLVQEIRVAIDSNLNSEQLTGIGDIDTLALEEIIGSKIAEAARIVVLNAPSYLLDGGESLGATVSWNGTSGRIKLPENFLRLVVFKMSDWSRAVTVPISDTDPQYALQSSRWAGVRGNPQKPVVAIVPDADGLVLEFYTSNAGTVEQATYIAMPKVTEGKIKLCEKLHDATVYYAAYLTAISTGETEISESLLRIVNELNK